MVNIQPQYIVQIGINIDNEIKCINYKASTLVVAKKIRELYNKENWCVYANIRYDNNLMFTWDIGKHQTHPIDNLARLFLVDYWIDGEIRNNKLIYDDSKIWDVIR